MKRRRIEIINTECRRGCGRKIATVSRSIHGAAAAHAKFSGICEQCITPEERLEMEGAVQGAVFRSCCGK